MTQFHIGRRFLGLEVVHIVVYVALGGGDRGPSLELVDLSHIVINFRFNNLALVSVNIVGIADASKAEC
jgi:hypothetical protein